MKNITSSVYTFEDLITGGFLYVDKTEYIWRLIQPPKGIYFLSRPRRFGKSLTLSTLKAVFQNKKHLFKGLTLESKPYDWKEYPVIHLDLGSCGSSGAKELERYLCDTINFAAEQHGLSLTRTGSSGRFTELVQTLSARGKVVVLIDEYDKPILDNITKDYIQDVREVLENFYSVVKATEPYQRFVMMTGVSKFSKVSVFSKLNNLADISADERFAVMLGYTQEEFESNFTEHIDLLTQKNNVSREELLGGIKEWYNGYRFHSGAPSVYNPVSVAKFFEVGGEFRNFWFSTGTPSFLLKLAKQQSFDFEEALSEPVSELLFDCYEIGKLKTLPLLLQTGYLTIKSAVSIMGSRRYYLDFPNREVAAAFEAYLLEEYANTDKESAEVFAVDMAGMLQSGDLDGAMKKLRRFFAGIPYDIQLPLEKYYQTIFFVIFRLTGLFIEAEARSSDGRVDAVAKAGEYIYIFEFKLNGSAEEALAQIRAKEYWEKYAGSGKEIILAGVGFSYEKRGIDGWLREKAPPAGVV